MAALERTAYIFTSRLATLARLLETAEAQAADVEALIAARLADDMYATSAST